MQLSISLLRKNRVKTICIVEIEPIVAKMSLVNINTNDIRQYNNDPAGRARSLLSEWPTVTVEHTDGVTLN